MYMSDVRNRNLRAEIYRNFGLDSFRSFFHVKQKRKFRDIIKLPFCGSKNHCSPKLNDCLDAILLQYSHA